jgi:hypothetical protein
MADIAASWSGFRSKEEVLRRSLSDGLSELLTGARLSAAVTGEAPQTVDVPEDRPDAQPLSHPFRALPDKFWLMLLIVWALSIAYTTIHLKRGWIPHDEGAFAQSAERVLNGELPHRDFDEVYTGGLIFANALAFRVFGVNLASIRIVLLVFFVAWVPALFYIASRFVSPYASAGLTLLAVAWSVPNYSAAVPSWYNLFFAVFGTAALLRYMETKTHRWVFIAGLCAGLSIVVKIIGLYFVAAGILFFVFREQSISLGKNRTPQSPARLYPGALLIGLVVFAFLLGGVILRGPGSNGLINFLLPAYALFAVLASREFVVVPTGDKERFAALFRMLLPFAAGISVPVLIFLVPFLRSGSVSALIHGIFVLPTKRFYIGVVPSPGLAMMMKPALIALFLSVAYYTGKRVRIVCGVFLGLYLGYLLQFSAHDKVAYRAGWFSAAASVPLIVLAAAVYLGVPRLARILDPEQQQQLMLLVSALAMTSLVQFPFSAPIYFCYAAPVGVLAAGALLALIPRPPRFALSVLLVFYLIFVVYRVTPAFVFDMGYTAAPDGQTKPLKLARGGNLRGDPIQAEIYEELIPFIQTHASGEFTYAGPDCPEIYFLTGLKNPTRTLGDSFDEPEGRTERILQAIETHHITVLTFNEKPAFAGTINRELEQVVQSRFPQSKQIGNFRVMWRE